MTTPISHVSDTALWVAVYREHESQRSDALFHDPFAGLLTGDRGRNIEKRMIGSRFTAWSIVIRTVIIDAFVQQLVKQGVDTVLNLGCGLDTRPYRMLLPADLRWIEVDFPHMIELKNERMAGQKPVCRLDRFAVDLTKPEETQKLFARISSESKKVLVITEGVVPYLTNEQAAELARNLRAQKNFNFWIVDYFSPLVMKYVRGRRRQKQMKNAPFVFEPLDWFEFFKNLGWKTHDIRYLGEESIRLGRAIPLPWWVHILRFIFRPKHNEIHLRYSAYVVLEPKD